MSQVMTQALIDGTEDLIRESGQPISLIRPSAWETTPSGGQRRVDGAEATMDPVERFFSAVTSGPAEIWDERGQILRLNHVLIGMPEDDIQEGDTFLLNNRTFEVRWIHPNVTYEVRAFCMEKA